MTPIATRTARPHGGARSRRRRARLVARSALGSVLAVVVATWAAAPAEAYFRVTGAGAGQAVTSGLSAPGTPIATATVGSGTVPVAWTAASLSGGQAPQGYYVLRVRTSDQATAAACGTGPATLTTQLSCNDLTVPDGTYRYQVIAVQHSWTATSALSASVTVVNDASLPKVSVTGTSPTPNANGYINSSPVTVTLTATPGTGGIAITSITAWVDAGTPSTTLGSTKNVSVSGDGVHVVSYYATDLLGHSSLVATYTVRIDRVAPSAPGVPALTAATDSGRSSSDGVTNATSPALTGTAEAGSTVTAYDGATALGTSVATGGTWTLSVTLAAGSHTITAKATDLAGNTSVASAAATVVVDRTAPNAPATPALAAASDSGRANNDKITNVTTPTFSGTSEANAVVTLYDGTTVVATTTASGTSWTTATSALGDGAHTITAKAADLAGNLSSASNGVTVTIDTTAPSPPSQPLLASTSDTGISTTDGITTDDDADLHRHDRDQGDRQPDRRRHRRDHQWSGQHRQLVLGDDDPGQRHARSHGNRGRHRRQHQCGIDGIQHHRRHAGADGDGRPGRRPGGPDPRHHDPVHRAVQRAGLRLHGRRPDSRRHRARRHVDHQRRPRVVHGVRDGHDLGRHRHAHARRVEGDRRGGELEHRLDQHRQHRDLPALGASPLSRRSPTTTRLAIQATALDLFLRQGYDVTTLEQIATRLGLTRPAILYHFHHKEELLHSVVEPALVAVERALEPFQGAGSSCKELHAEVLRALLTASLAHRAAVALMSRFANEHTLAGLGERATAANARCVELISGPDRDDPSRRLRAVATLAALGGVMGARTFVPIDTEDERESLVRGLLALLHS